MVKQSYKLFFCLYFISVLNVSAAQSQKDWPLWQSFWQEFVTLDGRVVDPYNDKNITTSEGQSYALFFALVNNQPERFSLLLDWTEKNLAQGDLTKYLPAWQWGKAENGQWQVLDNNSASDSDLWIVYSLLEAARLWHKPEYFRLANKMAELILAHEVAELPGLGQTLLPAPYGFYQQGKLATLNPSYVPLQLLEHLANALDNEKWTHLLHSSYQLISASSPLGFAPDWVDFDENHGLIHNKPKGSYDAIRVYLWSGMLASSSTYAKNLRAMHQPILKVTEKNNYPPISVDVTQGITKGRGGTGFMAALLPLAMQSKKDNLVDTLLANIAQAPLQPGKSYYNHMLTLFGMGWYEQRFSFEKNGKLQLPWCCNE